MNTSYLILFCISLTIIAVFCEDTSQNKVEEISVIIKETTQKPTQKTNLKTSPIILLANKELILDAVKDKCASLKKVYQKDDNGIIRITEHLIKASQKWKPFNHQLAFLPFAIKIDSKIRQHALEEDLDYIKKVHFDVKKILNEYLTLYPFRKAIMSNINLPNFGSLRELLKC
uniref:Lipoprotein n=1 Tax=Rhabditophanes sp. KR3021 TaxID=114890 RepID=A0AC35TR58_9BILA